MAKARNAEWFMQTVGVSHHFQQTTAPGREWQEQHPGLGFERRSEGLGSDAADWTLSSMGGVMQDSRGFWGGYAGAAYMRQWQPSRSLSLGAGLGAQLFYRSASWNGRMTLVPAVLPVASVGLPVLGMKLNMVYVPEISAFSKSMPPVLHVQVGFRFP